MKLQLALDETTIQEGVELIKDIESYIDIVEIGTPMVIEYGMEAVRTVKQKFPQKEILADLKIMDAGYYEAEKAFKAGADYITVLGVTDNLTIKGCVDAAAKYNGQVVVDMICVADLESRIKKMEELGVDYVSVHIGVDQQAVGRTPIDDLKIMRKTVKTANISVAGGISVETIGDYKEYDPEVVIVGSGITHSKNPLETVQKLRDAMK